MAKRAYAGISGTGYKVQKLYAGVEGVSRKVKKAYLGIKGVAKIFFQTGADIAYYGNSEDGTVQAPGPGDVPIGVPFQENALFKFDKSLIWYDRHLTRHDVIPDSSMKHNREGSGESDENHALFFTNDGTQTTEKTTVSVDQNFIFTRIYGMGYAGGYRESAAAKTKDYIINAGGYGKQHSYDSGYSNSSYCHFYSDDLIRRDGYLGESKKALAGASIGGHALFAGGYNGKTTTAISRSVDAFDNNLVRKGLDDLTVGRQSLKGSSIYEKFAVFSGGFGELDGAYEYRDTVEVYDEVLVHHMTQPLSEAKVCHAAVSLVGATVVSGGMLGGRNGGDGIQSYYPTVDVYDEELVKTSPFALEKAMAEHSMARAGDFAILCGKCPDGTMNAEVLRCR